LAGKEMEQLGFDVVHMKGGIIGWRNKGYELEK
jgi:rhodanese-related sulfurtransferase